MNLRVEKVEADDIEAVHDILVRCGNDLRDTLGLRHWQPPWPLEWMQRDTVEREVYAVYDGDSLVATYTIGDKLPHYYGEDAPIPKESFVFLNRLAVLPQLQDLGIGSWCMETIEENARTRGHALVVLDAYAGHKKLLDYYRERGYRQVGALADYGWEVICFEKKVTSDE